MGSLKFLYKVTRIEQCIIAGLSTWLIALLSNGPLWSNEPKVAAGVSMFFSCLGASLFHYGRRHDIYAKKWYDLVIVNQPLVLILSGAIAFLLSIAIAGVFLPAICTWIALFNFAMIMFYANFLDQYWPFKNLAIASVCVSPVVMGWYSGHRMHPIVPFLMAGIFCAYLAREVLKDNDDLAANRGKRFTMVMSLGMKTTQRIAGALLFLSILCFIGGLLQLRYTELFSAAPVFIFFLIGMYFMINLAKRLLPGSYVSNRYRVIDLGMVNLMIATLMLRITLY